MRYSTTTFSFLRVALGLTALTLGIAATSEAQFARKGVRLLSNLPLSAFPGDPSSGSGGWGYVSASEREYAVFGVRNGTAVVDITNPTQPAIIGHVQGPNSTWHEPTVLGDFAYSVCDGVDQGMHIIDLRQADLGVITHAGTYTGNNLKRVHTIQPNPAKKLLYLNGSNIANGGLVVLDVSNPVAPVQVGAWTEKYVHDCQVVDFTSGPNAGKEIAFLCCGGAGLYIVDITDKGNMVTLGFIDYMSGSNYCHSGQLSPDGRYFLINDEFDEGNALVDECTTHIIDVSDLTNPTYAGRFQNGGQYIDHNSHVRGNLLYLAAYRGGLRIFDVADAQNIRELGYFDTHPNNGFSYSGAWGVCAIFPSGTVTIFDINRGLFVLDPGEAIGFGAPILSANVVAGDLISGGPKELRKSDDRRFVMKASDQGTSDVAELTVEINAKTDISPANVLGLQFETSCQFISTAKGKVMLWNWAQSRWDAVGDFDLTTVEGLDSISGLPGGTYVNSSGEIRMRLGFQPGPESEPSEYVIKIDMVRFGVES